MVRSLLKRLPDTRISGSKPAKGILEIWGVAKW
jgi:hypothetical protein